MLTQLLQKYRGQSCGSVDIGASMIFQSRNSGEGM